MRFLFRGLNIKAPKANEIKTPVHNNSFTDNDKDIYVSNGITDIKNIIIRNAQPLISENTTGFNVSLVQSRTDIIPPVKVVIIKETIAAKLTYLFGSSDL